MEGIENNDASYVLEYLKRMQNGCSCYKLLDDCVTESAYRTIMKFGNEGLIGELRETKGFKEEIYSKVLMEIKEGNKAE